MKIVINGEPRDSIRAANIRELIEDLALPSCALLVEHNGVALRPAEWPDLTLAEGDRIEFVRIVAGG